MPERRGGASGSDDPRGRGGGGPRRREHPRRFTDERGVLWTAEVQRVAGAPPQASPSASTLVLFSSESRACLASLPADPPFAELTVEELRRQLRACLSG